MDVQKDIPTEVKITKQPKFLRVLATIVSYIFHPVLMPTVIAYILYKLAPTDFAGISPHEFGLDMFRIAYITLFFPVLTVVLLKALGFIQSIHMHTSQDRIIPLIGTMIFYFWVIRVFNYVTPPSPFMLKVLLLGSFLGVIALFMVNIFFKISMHTCGAGSLVGIFIILMIYSPVNMLLPLLGSIILAGIIGSARMILGVHKRAEVWAGYIVGILVMFVAYWYLK